jgi:hypothetical protein
VSGGAKRGYCCQVWWGGGVCGGWRSAGMFKVEMSFFLYNNFPIFDQACVA